jgi:hypothetical protein
VLPTRQCSRPNATDTKRRRSPRADAEPREGPARPNGRLPANPGFVEAKSRSTPSALLVRTRGGSSVALSADCCFAGRCDQARRASSHLLPTVQWSGGSRQQCPCTTTAGTLQARPRALVMRSVSGCCSPFGKRRQIKQLSPRHDQAANRQQRGDHPSIPHHDLQQQSHPQAIIDGDEHVRHDRAHDGAGEVLSQLDRNDPAEATPSLATWASRYRRRMVDDRISNADQLASGDCFGDIAGVPAPSLSGP